MDIILKTNLLFTAVDEEVREGFVAIRGNKIAKTGTLDEIEQYIEEDTKVYDLTGQVVAPGFVDNHVFFTGYMWQRLGFDASGADSEDEVIDRITEAAAGMPAGAAVLGHGLKDGLEFASDRLNELFPERPVAVFADSREYCFMNRAAQERYGFSGDACWAEQCFRLFEEILRDKDYSREQYGAFQELLASKGITSIKEIGFDSYSGFADVLKSLEDEGKLTHRINLVSQPVAGDADFEYGEKCRKMFDGEKLRFMGYNIMVDGDIESGDGDLLDGYKDRPGVCCGMDIDYMALEKTVLEADKRGFRCALHAEGDSAVRKSIDIFEKCREVNGARDARHALVDVELIDPADRKRLKELDISAIEYIQIMNCYGSYEEYWDTDILSEERAKNIWAYKSTLEDGARLCFGTDLPLDVPDIPLSMRCGVYRLFPGDDTPEGGYHREEALTPAQILTCWSKNGQAANFEECRLGTLEEGKLADIAVLDTDVFHCGLEELKKAEVSMTIFDGRIVYKKQ